MLANAQSDIPESGQLTKKVGVVVIGRNEGARLKKCLESIDSDAVRIVYVDSGSTDDSIDLAHRNGAEVIALDTSIPFCAARARNAGFQRLVELNPRISFIQFIDGDCEIIRGWLYYATESLLKQPQLAIVAGWLREKFPEISIYNRMGDLEWNFHGVGEVEAVGGIFMIRRQAFDSVGGFDSTIAAGEEPELCQRLIRKGWRLAKLDREMALHDLAMTQFRQWWWRMVRSGYGSMDVARRFGIHTFVKNNWQVRIWFTWFLLLIAGSVLSGTSQYSGFYMLTTLVISIAWPAQWLRIGLRTWRNGQSLLISFAYAFFIMIAFLPQCMGQITYFADRLRNRSFRLVEYKSTAP